MPYDTQNGYTLKSVRILQHLLKLWRWKQKRKASLLCCYFGVD